jgi:hypothetical protein
MSLTNIRSFRIETERYRHAMCLNTDAVFLQRFVDNDDATCDDDLWLTLLKYDSSCNAWDAEGKRIGNFTTEGSGEQWVFYENPNRTRLAFPPTRGPEALLDTEVHYSKHWLEQKRIESYNGAVASANHIQGQIDSMLRYQDELLKEPAAWLCAKIRACESLEALDEINTHLDTWPRGFFRSEIRTVCNTQAYKLGRRTPNPAEDSPPASGPATLPPVTSDTRSQ